MKSEKKNLKYNKTNIFTIHDNSGNNLIACANNMSRTKTCLVNVFLVVNFLFRNFPRKADNNGITLKYCNFIFEEDFSISKKKNF
jgi:hypothetical protein